MVFGDTFEKDEDFGRSAPYFFVLFPIMKRLLILFVFSCALIYTNAYGFVHNGIYYSIHNNPYNGSNEVFVTQPEANASYSGIVNIPSSVTYKGISYNVTGISSRAFYNSTNLTSVSIPETVEYIGNMAFCGCTSLTTLKIKDGETPLKIVTEKRDWDNDRDPIEIIDTYSYFDDCKISSLYLGRDIFCDYYYDCFNGDDYSSVEEEWYGLDAFKPLYETVKNIVIGEDVSSVEILSSFKNLSSVTVNAYNINMHVVDNAIYSLDDTHLLSYYGNDDFEIPSTVTSISSHAFYNSSAKKIIVPASVTSMGYDVFKRCHCDLVVKCNIPEVTEFHGYTDNDYYYSGWNYGYWYWFKDCTFRSVTLGEGLSVGPYAFRGSSIYTLNVHYSTTFDKEYSSYPVNVYIANVSFDYSNIEWDRDHSMYERFKSINYYDGENLITNLEIPNSVTKIGSSAFTKCESLLSITIPNSVESIGYNAFSGCTNLTSITNLSFTPQAISSNTFSMYGTLHVPPGCKGAYENANYWKNFTIVEDAVIPCSIELADGKTYNEEIVQIYKEINYSRTFNNTSWQALYIPFSMSYDDWKDDFEVAFINSVRQYDNDEDGVVDETIMDVMKIKSGSLIPNTPYLIKAKSTGEKTITVNNATLYQAEENSIECSTMLAKYTFTGTYSTIPASTMSANNYYAMGGGSLIMTDGTSDLKPFRWYLNIESRSPMYSVSSAAKTITINVVGEEEATGISQMSSDREHSYAIYDLNGRKMSQKNLKSGLYIKNGKKIIIK